MSFQKNQKAESVNSKFRNSRLSALSVIVIALCSFACSSQPEAGTELKGLTLSKLAAQNYLEAINGQTTVASGTLTVPRSGALTVGGWATDTIAKLPASRVFVDLDGKLYPAQYGIARPDVAAALKDPAFTNTGYSATIPSPEGTGEHRVTIDIVAADNKTYYSGATAVFTLR